MELFPAKIAHDPQSVLEAELGPDWPSHFATFDMVPFAAASIGQVHRATLTDGMDVAVKIQFPGIADSIDADISTLKSLLLVSALLPKGLYLENTLRVLKRELRDECDYLREAKAARRFRNELADDPAIAVPVIVDHLCTSKVLTAQLMQGRPMSQVMDLDVETKNHVCCASQRPARHGLYLLSHIEDRNSDHQALSTRALPLSFHANRSELEQFFLERGDLSGGEGRYARVQS